MRDSWYILYSMHCKDQKGQGLLEVVIALGILTVGLFGVFTLVLGNFTSERAGMMRLQAMNLAREGIEAVKNIRDSNWLTDDKDAWDGIPANDDVILVYEPDGSKTLESGANDSAIYINQDNGLYLQGSNVGQGAQKTPFSRKINISKIDNDAGISINSHVEWFEGGREHEVNLVEELYDWR